MKNKELLKGASELVVLKVLEHEALYGYEIAKRIKETSQNVFAMGEGMLYPMLHKLEKSKLLDSYWQEIGGRRRKYYAITAQGRAALEQKHKEWQAVSMAVDAIMTS